MFNKDAAEANKDQTEARQAKHAQMQALQVLNAQITPATKLYLVRLPQGLQVALRQPGAPKGTNITKTVSVALAIPLLPGGLTCPPMEAIEGICSKIVAANEITLI